MSVLYLLLLIFGVNVVGAAGARAKIFTDENHYRMPVLFHLDDYERCLSQRDGVYCLGDFHLTPQAEPDDTYNLMKEYSESPSSFNRTLIHRGYCVSARCPSAERNASLRFERCAAQWGRERALRTTLHTLHYCRTHADKHLVKPPNTWQRLYKYIIYFILFLNIIGTAYDCLTKDDLQNNNLLKFWSVRSSWQRLTNIYDDGDPQLAALTPLHGARVFTLILTIGGHAMYGFIYQIYVQNPQFIEKMVRTSKLLILLTNGSAAMQALLVLSTFLTSYNILLLSQKYSFGVNILPIYIMKRASRVSPVALVLIGYMATWHASYNDGPLWPVIVTPETEICRRKFWWQFFYVNNIVDSHDYCLPPTWFLAADMHLGILAVFLTLMVVKLRKRALPVLIAMYFVSSIVISILTYVNKWKPLLHMIVVENLRIFLQNEPSFTDGYMSSWAAIPACILGVIMGLMQFENVQHGFKLSEHKRLERCYNMALPFLFTWILLGHYLREYTSTLASALILSVERPVFCISLAVLFYGACNIDGSTSRFFAWKGFQALSRLSLSAMLVNWIVIITIFASHQNLIVINCTDGLIYIIGVLIFTYIISGLLTILVEIPMRRFFGELMIRQLKKK